MKTTLPASSPSLGVIRAATAAVGPPTLAKDGDLPAATKRCSKCGVVKPAAAFAINKRIKCGLARLTKHNQERPGTLIPGPPFSKYENKEK